MSQAARLRLSQGQLAADDSRQRGNPTDDGKNTASRGKCPGKRQQTQIGRESSIPETEGGHDGKGPVQTGHPAVFPSFIEHEQMEENTVQDNDGEYKSDKFGQRAQIFSGGFILEEKQQLGRQKFHSESKKQKKCIV